MRIAKTMASTWSQRYSWIHSGCLNLALQGSIILVWTESNLSSIDHFAGPALLADESFVQPPIEVWSSLEHLRCRRTSGQRTLPWLRQPSGRCFHRDASRHWHGGRPLPPCHEGRHGKEGETAQLRGGAHHPAPVHQARLPEGLQVLAQVPLGQGRRHWEQCGGSSSHRLRLDVCQGRCWVRVGGRRDGGGTMKCIWIFWSSFGKWAH